MKNQIKLRYGEVEKQEVLVRIAVYDKFENTIWRQKKSFRKKNELVHSNMDTKDRGKNN
jgi:hypothetical protein